MFRPGRHGSIKQKADIPKSPLSASLPPSSCASDDVNVHRSSNCGAEDEHVNPDDEALSLWDLATFYSCHTLFMVNNRSYEFASVLFTASAFPATLLAASIRGVSTHLASVLISPAVGQWCRRNPSRLRPVQLCIIVQRLSIAIACLIWVGIVRTEETGAGNHRLGDADLTTTVRSSMFAVLVFLGMLIRLAAVGNQIVVERDWVPLISSRGSGITDQCITDERPESASSNELHESVPLLGGPQPTLHILNATTKRIDLVAKLATPLIVSATALGCNNLRWVAVLLAATQIGSLLIELYLTKRVWLAYTNLQAPKLDIPPYYPIEVHETPDHHTDLDSGHMTLRVGRSSHISFIYQYFRGWNRSIQTYIASPIVFPSVAFAIEPFSVLTMAGSMSAYLLVAHYPLMSVTIAKVASTAVEVLSTIVTPLVISWFARQGSNDIVATEPASSLVKVGILGLSWQFLTLIPAVGFLLYNPSFEWGETSPGQSKMTMVLFASLALSRFGPFAYSLVEQQIVQLTLLEGDRLEFSGVEMALFDLAELARWGMMGIFGRPSQFRWIAVASFGSVAMSLGLFLLWIRRHSAVR